MTATSDAAAQAAIGAASRELKLPTVRDQPVRLAEIAAREQSTYLAYLAEVLAAELDDRSARCRARRIAEARFPRLKRLADFSAGAVPAITPALLAHLAAGAYLDKGEPVVLLGDSGTGKTHLLIGLGLASCEQGRRVRYVTTAALVNELVEAAVGTDVALHSHAGFSSPLWTAGGLGGMKPPVRRDRLPQNGYLCGGTRVWGPWAPAGRRRPWR